MSFEQMKHKRTSSIGTRLTVLGAGLTLAICTLLCLGLYFGLSYSIQREVDTFLEGEISEFMLTVNEHGEDTEEIEQHLRQELGSRKRRDIGFRLLDPDGKVIVSSESDDKVAALWEFPKGWTNEPSHFVYRTVKPSGSKQPVRTCSIRVVTKTGQIATAQASYNLDRTQESLAFFRLACAIALGCGVLLSLGAGYFIAQRSLRPARTLIGAAQRINAQRLRERVPTTGSGDELDQLAVALNEMLNRIEHHVRQMQQFTADASHELRTPLAALRGNAEVALNRERSAEELREVVENSIEHYDRLARIAEDLLLLARADAGHHVLRMEKIELGGTIKRAVDLYEPLARDNGIELDFRKCTEIKFEGDKGRLRQLVGNLLDNAIRHTNAGGLISVSLDVGNEAVKLEVKDTGTGIPEEHLTRVFDRFYRVDSARSAQHGGAGLGLPICRMIAECHGGNINIFSHSGQGTSVVVTLPINGGTVQRP